METLEKQFKKSMYVGYETSISPHINREKKVMEYNVGWIKEEERGWFEMYDEDSGGEDYYGEGMLEFNGNKLVGYDGVFSLDENIIDCVKKMGAIINL
mgnify:CR=1 FL=1|tara:strand:+ start:3560 stop:3853 length:294 start_codon:yes stop_codon:yes gene_type:complete